MKIAKCSKIAGLLCAAAVMLSVLSACGVTSAVQDPESEGEPVLWAEQMSARKTETVNRTMKADPFDEKLLD